MLLIRRPVAGGEAEEEMDTEMWQNDVLDKLGSLSPDEFEESSRSRWPRTASSTLR